MGFLFDLLFELIGCLIFEPRQPRPEELERRYGPERHPVDLLDTWARREGVRLLDFRRTHPAGRTFRAHVAFPDGRRAWAIVTCGDPEAGLRSDRVEGVWEPEPARALRRPPADDPLYDDLVDGAPAA